MSFLKAIDHHKEFRKHFNGSKLLGPKTKLGICRCHGGCNYCLDNRFYAERKRIAETEQDVAEFRTFGEVGTVSPRLKASNRRFDKRFPTKR